MYRYAIRNGNFLTWPGVNIPNISRFLPDSFATALGHLDQELAILKYTKLTVPPSINLTMTSEDKDFAPAISNTKKFDVCGAIITSVATRTGYHDINGAFQHKSVEAINIYIYYMIMMVMQF